VKKIRRGGDVAHEPFHLVSGWKNVTFESVFAKFILFWLIPLSKGNSAASVRFRLKIILPGLPHACPCVH